MEYFASNVSPWDFSEMNGGEIDHNRIHQFHQIRDRFFKDMFALFGKEIMLVGIEWGTITCQSCGKIYATFPYNSEIEIVDGKGVGLIKCGNCRIMEAEANE